MEHDLDSLLQTDVTWDGVAATVTVAGELDITAATSMSRRLLAIGAAHPQRLVLDLRGLVFVDVAGARALDEAYKALTGECPVLVRQPPPSARKIFELTGLMDIPPSGNARTFPAAVLGRVTAACRRVRRVVPHPGRDTKVKTMPGSRA